MELSYATGIPVERLLCGFLLKSLKPRSLDLDGLPQERRADLVQGPANQSTVCTNLLFEIGVVEDHGMYLEGKRSEGSKSASGIHGVWWRDVFFLEPCEEEHAPFDSVGLKVFATNMPFIFSYDVHKLELKIVKSCERKQDHHHQDTMPGAQTWMMQKHPE